MHVESIQSLPVYFFYCYLSVTFTFVFLDLILNKANREKTLNRDTETKPASSPQVEIETEVAEPQCSPDKVSNVIELSPKLKSQSKPKSKHLGLDTFKKKTVSELRTMFTGNIELRVAMKLEYGKPYYNAKKQELINILSDYYSDITNSISVG